MTPIPVADHISGDRAGNETVAEVAGNDVLLMRYVVGVSPEVQNVLSLDDPIADVTSKRDVGFEAGRVIVVPTVNGVPAVYRIIAEGAGEMMGMIIIPSRLKIRTGELFAACLACVGLRLGTSPANENQNNSDGDGCQYFIQNQPLANEGHRSRSIKTNFPIPASFAIIAPLPSSSKVAGWYPPRPKEAGRMIVMHITPLL
jgi:hypothetical protein